MEHHWHHSDPQGGKFDSTAILKSREDPGMSDEWVHHLWKYPEFVWSSLPRPRMLTMAERKFCVALIVLSKNVVFYVHQCSVLKTCASLFHVLVEFCESQKVVSLKEGNSMVKLIKDAFGIVKQFTSIFSSVCGCLPKLNHLKYLESCLLHLGKCTKLEGTIC